jgi:DNA-binding MarR family transcriptional regulator
MPKPNTVSPLEAHLGYWLRFVSNHVSQAFSEKLKAKDISVAEWVILRELYVEQPPAPSALALRLGMTKGGVSKLLDRLTAKGWATQTAGTEDRRYRILALTAQGRVLVPKLAALADQNDAEFFGHLKPAERAGLEAVMKDIVRRRGLQTAPVD